jgi:hypothetical protein
MVMGGIVMVMVMVMVMSLIDSTINPLPKVVTHSYSCSDKISCSSRLLAADYFLWTAVSTPSSLAYHHPSYHHHHHLWWCKKLWEAETNRDDTTQLLLSLPPCWRDCA